MSLLSLLKGYRCVKSFTKYLTFQTQKRREYINITADVMQSLRESGIQEGFVLVSAMHITASVYVNDDEDGLIADIDEWLERLAPMRPDYHHHQTGEDNGDAHLKNTSTLITSFKESLGEVMTSPT